MAEELTTGTEGQSTEGSETTTSVESEGQSGAASTEGTTQEGTQQTSEETFFDPRSLDDKPELQSAYKQMQSAFTKKMQGIKDNKQKIDAYDAFYQDPLSQIQQIASQMGYSLTRAEAKQVADNQSQENWEPQNWDEVLTKAEQRAYDRIKQDLGPVFNQVKELRESNLERFMDDNFSDWRLHEDEMMQNLKSHPTLVNNPTALYRMSVPPEVLESRATQAALKKLQTKAEGSRTSGASTTKHKEMAMPDKSLSFQEAVEFAKKQVAAKGIAKP